MKSFMEFVQLKNEAEAPTPAPAAPAAQAQAPTASAQAPVAPAGAAPAPAAQQQNTPTNQLLDYLEKNKSNIKHYRKFAKVKARQSAGGEEVQTKLNGRDESEVRTTQPNDWVVSNIESQGENQIVDDKTFRKRYDVANPKGDIYSPKAAEFFGVVYNGEKISFAPPNWGGDIMHIENGYMIGGPNPNEFNKDFYGIDPVAFSKTYKTADQVAESTWMLEVFGESPSKKNYDGINEIFGLFGKKPAPAAAPAPQRKPPVTTCPFCRSETVFSGSDDSYAPTYAPVLQCEKCNKYWAGNKVPPSGLDPKMAKDSDTKMIVGSVSESAWMRSFLTESFKPYKKSTSDW